MAKGKKTGTDPARNAQQSAPGAETAQAPGTALVAAPIKLPAGLTVKRQVIMPTLNLKVGEPRVLYCVEAMRESTYKETDPKKEKEKPATIMPVGDVMDGTAYTLLVPAVLESSIREAYPQDSYVGKMFYMEKLPKRAGKRYFDFRLLEAEGTPAPGGAPA